MTQGIIMGQRQDARAQPRRWSSRGGSVLVVGLLALGACTDQGTSPMEPPAPIADIALTEAITPDLALAWDARGPGATPLTQPDNGLSEAEAVGLAVLFVEQLASHFRPTLRRHAGREVSIQDLEPTGNVIFAETPYQSLPAGTMPAAVAAAGPSYLVEFADERGRAAVVSVSAHATHVRAVNGVLQRPPIPGFGNEFRIVGLDEERRYGPTFSPESAVKTAFAVLGVRVSEPPRFVKRGVGWFPTVGSWELTLESPVLVRSGAGEEIQTQTVFLEPLGILTVPVGAGSPVDLSNLVDGLTLMPSSGLGRDRVSITPIHEEVGP